MTDFTNIVDQDLPVIDRLKVEPTVKEVALLERTRTADRSGDEQGDFTPDTRPTRDEVEQLISQAVELVLIELPDYVPTAMYPRVQQAAALKAAILIEISFYREQSNQGSVRGYEQMYTTLVQSLEDEGGTGGGNRVDSIMGRSTIAEYDPYLPPVPPKVVMRPITLGEDADSEAS